MKLKDNAFCVTNPLPIFHCDYYSFRKTHATTTTTLGGEQYPNLLADDSSDGSLLRFDWPMNHGVRWLSCSRLFVPCTNNNNNHSRRRSNPKKQPCRDPGPASMDGRHRVVCQASNFFPSLDTTTTTTHFSWIDSIPSFIDSFLPSFFQHLSYKLWAWTMYGQARVDVAVLVPLVVVGHTVMGRLKTTVSI